MDVLVREGGEDTLSTQEPGRYRDAIVNLRPRSLRALRSIVTADVRPHFDYGQDADFEELDNPGELVRLDLSGSQPLNGVDPALFRAILATVPFDAPEIPSSLGLVQRSRLFGPGFSFVGGEPLAGRAVRIRELLVPDWIRDFQVYLPVFLLNDVIVEAGATLVLAGNSLPARVNDFLIRPGGRVRQTAGSVKLDIRGRLQGDVA